MAACSARLLSAPADVNEHRASWVWRRQLGALWQRASISRI